MKNEEIKTLSVEQLNARLKELKTELFNLRFSHTTRNLSNPLEIRNVRKDENISKGYMNGKYGAIPFIHNPLIFPVKEEN